RGSGIGRAGGPSLAGESTVRSPSTDCSPEQSKLFLQLYFSAEQRSGVFRRIPPLSYQRNFGRVVHCRASWIGSGIPLLIMTSKLLAASVLALFILRPLAAFPPNADRDMVDVTGEVRLVEGKSQRAARDASEVVVWLVSVPGTGEPSSTGVSTKTHYRILQHNKTFEPKLLVVPLGSIVDFPNLDPWFHNVFSLYQGKRFDLGLYQAGSEKEVVFDRPGPSFLFC